MEWKQYLEKPVFFLTYENWLTASHVKCTQCENPKWFESIGLQNYWLPPAVSRGIHGLTHLTELPEFFLNLFVQTFWRTSVLFVQPLIPVLDFRPNLTRFSNPGRILSLECFVTCPKWNPQIFLKFCSYWWYISPRNLWHWNHVMEPWERLFHCIVKDDNVTSRGSLHYHAGCQDFSRCRTEIWIWGVQRVQATTCR